MFNYLKFVFTGITVFSSFISCFSQNIAIEGVWFNEKNGFLEIKKDKKHCSISNGVDVYSFGDNNYTINNDTLSVFDIGDEYKLQFKIKQPSTIQLELLPINREAKVFLEKDTVLTLIKQGFIVDNSIEFEQITYNYNLHSCDFGECQEKHIRINSKGEVFLLRESINPFTKPQSKARYFYGKLNESELKELKRLLTLSNLRNLKFDNVDCCESVITVLVIYFNGEKKYLKSTNPPPITTNLINYLESISQSQHTLFLESDKQFKFEGRLRLDVLR